MTASAGARRRARPGAGAVICVVDAVRVLSVEGRRGHRGVARCGIAPAESRIAHSSPTPSPPSMTTDFSPAPTSPRRPVAHGFTAILLATAPALGDVPAAALAWNGTTIGARLRDQIVELGADEVHLVTRPAWTGSVAGALGGDDAHVHASAGLAEDMRVIARIAEAADGPVIVANADIVTQGEALAGLLADPRIRTGILVSSWRASRLEAFGVQARVGHVVTVGTPYHHIAGASQRFLGVIKVAAADRLTLAKVAGDFAQTLERPMSAWWRRNAALKERQWRLSLHRRALRRSAGDGS